MIPDEARWYENEEENRAAQAALDEFFENYIEPTVDEPVDPAVERTVNLPLNPTNTCEDSKLVSLSTLSSLTCSNRIHYRLLLLSALCRPQEKGSTPRPQEEQARTQESEEVQATHDGSGRLQSSPARSGLTLAL